MESIFAQYQLPSRIWSSRADRWRLLSTLLHVLLFIISAGEPGLGHAAARSSSGLRGPSGRAHLRRAAAHDSDAHGDRLVQALPPVRLLPARDPTRQVIRVVCSRPSNRIELNQIERYQLLLHSFFLCAPSQPPATKSDTSTTERLHLQSAAIHFTHFHSLTTEPATHNVSQAATERQCLTSAFPLIALQLQIAHETRTTSTLLCFGHYK